MTKEDQDAIRSLLHSRGWELVKRSILGEAENKASLICDKGVSEREADFMRGERAGMKTVLSKPENMLK